MSAPARPQYTASNPHGAGVLCAPCTTESIEDRASFPSAAKGAAAAKKPPKKKAQRAELETLYTPVPTLQQTCLAVRPLSLSSSLSLRAPPSLPPQLPPLLPPSLPLPLLPLPLSLFAPSSFPPLLDPSPPPLSPHFPLSLAPHARPRTSLIARRARSSSRSALTLLPSSLRPQVVGQYATDIEALGDIGLKNLDRVAKVLCKNRALTGDNLKLFLEVGHRELRLYDCTRASRFVPLSSSPGPRSLRPRKGRN